MKIKKLLLSGKLLLIAILIFLVLYVYIKLEFVKVAYC